MVLSVAPLWLPGRIAWVVRVMDNAMVVRTVWATLTAMAILNSVLAAVTFLARARVSAAVSSLVLVRIVVWGLSTHRVLRRSRLVQLARLPGLRQSHMPNRRFLLHGYILRWVGIYTMEDRGCWGPALFRSRWRARGLWSSPGSGSVDKISIPLEDILGCNIGTVCKKIRVIKY